MDLNSTLETAAQLRRSEGWIVEPLIVRSALFFCERHGERQQVGIEQADPALLPFWGVSLRE